MVKEKAIDIKESYVKQLDDDLLSILLKDRSSNKNIIWATDNYAMRGSKYYKKEQITVEIITGKRGCIIKPRVEKSKKEQTNRIKEKAEVFTPSWICNKQNNLVDSDWFGRENVFNAESNQKWVVNREKIIFPNTEGKTWQDYVKANRMEISCGEAPYLVSRYDTVSGEWITVDDRIGLLDRKIRIVSENTDTEKDWYEWVLQAYKSIYGFEWQGDNLLIARENLLFTFIDYYLDRFNLFPMKEYLSEIAKIISWNIWQMDGLKYVIPESCKPEEKLQMSFFDEEEERQCEGCLKGDNTKHTGIYCYIMDWEKNKKVKFISLVEGNQ